MNNRLDGAKAICRYLNISRETMYEWSRTRELPVRRTLSGRVFALRDDLNEWLKCGEYVGNCQKLSDVID